MDLSSPLNTPTNIGIANITLSAENAVAISQSPFTYQQQVVVHPGQRWAASVSLPPMKRQDAEYWVAFLLSLKGQVGTFLLGDPNCVIPQGSYMNRNIISYTEQFDNAAWSKTNTTVTANSVADPNGAILADTIIENTAVNVTHNTVQTSTFIAGFNYTFSVYIKAQSTREVRLSLPTTLFSSSTAAVFSPTTGTIIFTVGSPTATIELISGGWYRVSISKLCSVSGTGSVFITLASGGIQSYTGDGVSGAYIWGAQVEIGSVPSTYKTVVAPAIPSVNGGSQTGDTLIIDGCTPSQTRFLLPGDYVQLGSSTTTQLYKVLTQVNTDASGNATLDLWPNLRTSPADNEVLTFISTKGRFRLKDNVTQWGINEISSYGITFDCVEAL